MTEKQRQASIDFILDQGLMVVPSTWGRLQQLYRHLGWQMIFWDMGYSLLFAALTLGGVFVLYWAAPTSYLASATLITTPLIYLLLNLFTETAEMLSGLYELKQTLRYSVSQVTALRILCFSILGIILGGLVVVSRSQSVLDFSQLFLLSLTGLFVIASLSLHIRRWFRNPWATAYFFSGWLLLNIALPYTFQERWELLLRQIPLPMSLSLTILTGVVLFHFIRQQLKEATHAYTA